MRHVWIIATIAAGCLAQDGPTFEVASIKPADIAPGGGFTMWRKGGPGTDDPTRIDYHNVSLSDLISKAYGVEYYQIVGPDWLRTQRYQIDATVAPGSTKDQLPLMFRNLLADRFKVQLHRDRKEMDRYSLTVAKGGPKFAAHVETPPDEKPQSFGSHTDADGYPVIPRAGVALIDGRARGKFPDAGVNMIANLLQGQLHSPVIDDTGLTGKYDFDLFWDTRPASAADNGPDLVTAVQQQLGLRLERKKALVDVVVVDHAERTPTAN
ncbi:MAG TPA: TIGR03435 family protein [Bryobacteraceae bacterium]|nr:TIGR03435 family protein [Bryobacteraceae bacterium]